MMGPPETFSRFEGEKVISLETYRKNGEPVRTPVWFLKENGILYVHTDDSTGKVKRIRNNPKVRVAPSHFRGKPKTEYVDARAKLETSPEIVRKYRSEIYKKYGLQGTFTRFLQRFSMSEAGDVIIAIHLLSQVGTLLKQQKIDFQAEKASLHKLISRSLQTGFRSWTNMEVPQIVW